MNSNSRLEYLDYIRVIAMLMIVALHCLCYYTGKWGYPNSPRIELYDGITDILHGIALPLFTCLSGFLYAVLREVGKYTDYRLYIIGKVKRLLMPLVVLSLFCMLIIPGAEFRFTALFGYHHLWFLGMLFWLFSIAPILENIAHRNIIKVLIYGIIIVVISFLFSKNPLAKLPIEIDNAGKYMCAFFAGMALGVHRERLAGTRNKVLYRVGTVTFIAFSAESMIWRHIDSYLIVMVCQFSRYLLSTLICMVILMLFMKSGLKMTKWIRYLSTLSMGIYVIHHIVIELLLQVDVVDKLMRDHVVLSPIMMMVVVLLVSTLLADTIKRNRLLSNLI